MVWEMTCWEICVYIRESGLGGGGRWVMKIPAEVEKMLSGKYQNAQQACKQALIPAWICAAQHFKIYF